MSLLKKLNETAIDAYKQGSNVVIFEYIDNKQAKITSKKLNTDCLGLFESKHISYEVIVESNKIIITKLGFNETKINEKLDIVNKWCRSVENNKNIITFK